MAGPGGHQHHHSRLQCEPPSGGAVSSQSATCTHSERQSSPAGRWQLARGLLMRHSCSFRSGVFCLQSTTQLMSGTNLRWQGAARVCRDSEGDDSDSDPSTCSIYSLSQACRYDLARDYSTGSHCLQTRPTLGTEMPRFVSVGESRSRGVAELN